MSLSDCLKCWDTPCTCGWEYRKNSIKSLQERIDMLEKVKQFLIANPKAKFSDYTSPFTETKDDKKFMEYMYSK